ncbi:MAG: zinc-binding dehydrogenase [Thermoanaerobaculia bacterium]
MRAWIRHEGRLQFRDVPEPRQNADELLVRVEAISLNRGELRTAKLGTDGTIPGWDIAGTVTAAAPSGRGPAAGTRVAAMLSSGAWAEFAAVPIFQAAVVPDELSLTTAVTLPLAGLTAMRVLAIGGALLGKNVLITGASGGVGVLAVQLAALAGANVDATCSPARADSVRALGAKRIFASTSEATGSYDLILESVGGESLAAAIERIASGGTIVTIGNSSERETTFNPRTLYVKGGASIYGLIIFEEVASRRIGARELQSLLELARAGTLRPVVEVERSWSELEAVLQDLSERKFGGKAVLRVE